jgi:F0F1-type ATP synthase assembly protein I
VSQRDQQHMWELAGRYSAIGIEMAIALCLPTLGGVWADRHFATTPWLFLFGLVVGLGAASQTVYRVVKSARRRGE